MKQITIIEGKGGTFDFSDRPLPQISKRFAVVKVAEDVLTRYAEARDAWETVQKELGGLFADAKESPKV